MTQLEQDYFHLELLPEGICWMRRTPREYCNLAEVSRAYYELFEVTDSWRRHQVGGSFAPIGFLHDVRGGPVGRSDPAFEDIHKRFRQTMLMHNGALVVLVRSAAGVMQLTRMIRDDNHSFSVTRDETSALTILREHLVRVGATSELAADAGQKTIKLV